MSTHLKADKQTVADLGLFGAPGTPSIYGLFHRTCTQGGSARLETRFREPLADADAINQRAAIYRYFSTTDYRFPVDAATVGIVSYYMDNDDVRSQLQLGSQSFGQRFRDLVATDADVKFVRDGVIAAVRLHHAVSTFTRALERPASDHPFASSYDELTALLADPVFADLRDHAGEDDPKLHTVQLADIDKRIRFTGRDKTLRLLDVLYELDVLIAVGQVARERGFAFATAHPKDSGVLRYAGVAHPHVENAITNDLELNDDNRILFLTGANMAGKSTLMKSLGIALYLAHMGFPVAANTLDFAVLDGIYTSINLADNLTAGASHYYAEVLRVKEVAQSLRDGHRLLVIFDELFRGTNVKDAHDATVALTRGFARCRGSRFIISTHIMEAGEQLQQETLPISYQYLPTRMEGNIPVYTRVLENGITADRQGMIIIENEGILDMLDQGIKNKKGTMA